MTREERVNQFTRTLDEDVYEVLGIKSDDSVVRFKVEVVNGTDKTAENECRTECEKRGFDYVKKTLISHGSGLYAWDVKEILPLGKRIGDGR